MTLSDFIKNDNKTTQILTGLLVLAVLYIFALNPLLNKNTHLQADLNAEKELAVYLNQTKQQLARLASYPTTSKDQAHTQITAVFQAHKIKPTSLTTRNNLTITSIKKIPFSQLLNILQQLKNQHGIVATEADIKRLDTGIVSAHLTLQIP